MLNQIVSLPACKLSPAVSPSGISGVLKQSDSSLRKIRLTRSEFRRELEFMARKDDISESLSVALCSLLEIFLAKREHSLNDHPIVDEGILSSVKMYTDGGLFHLDGKAFQICILKSRDPEGHPPRLTMVQIGCSRYRIYPI